MQINGILLRDCLEGRVDYKVLNVWTNGRAIRKYIGQDNRSNVLHKTKEKGWYKAKAILIPQE